jgi:hypothetical protein
VTTLVKTLDIHRVAQGDEREYRVLDMLERVGLNCDSVNRYRRGL